MTDLRKRFLEVQKELPKIEKDGNNPHFKSAYATLPQVLSKVTPVLHKHGFYVSADESLIEGNEYLTVRIIDSTSEDYVHTDVKLINVSDMQKLGSAFTYAFRYGLLALLGIAPDMDDDGNIATDKEPPKAPKQEAKKKEPPKTTEATFEEIIKLYETNKSIIPTNWIEAIEGHIKSKSMPDLQKVYVAIKKEVENAP